MLTVNPCLLQMGWCVQYCSLFKWITTQLGPLPIFDHLHITLGPFTSSNTKVLWYHLADNKSKIQVDKCKAMNISHANYKVTLSTSLVENWPGQSEGNRLVWEFLNSIKKYQQCFQWIHWSLLHWDRAFCGVSKQLAQSADAVILREACIRFLLLLYHNAKIWEPSGNSSSSTLPSESLSKGKYGRDNTGSTQSK